MSAAQRVLVVGAGGLSSPMLRLLAKRGGVHITLVDDDVVDESNLHRQTLYVDADVGRSKIERAERALRELSPELSVETVEGAFPLRVERCEIRQGCCGDGAFRGGLGLRRDVRNF